MTAEYLRNVTITIIAENHSSDSSQLCNLLLTIWVMFAPKLFHGEKTLSSRLNGVNWTRALGRDHLLMLLTDVYGLKDSCPQRAF